MSAAENTNAALQRAVASFDPAAADFSRLSTPLWDRVGQATVQVSKPEPGEWVLDACCGDGASAIPAARLVGPTGHVDAVDLSAPLATTVTAAAAELPQLTAYRTDVLEWPGAPERQEAPGEVRSYDGAVRAGDLLLHRHASGHRTADRIPTPGGAGPH